MDVLRTGTGLMRRGRLVAGLAVGTALVWLLARRISELEPLAVWQALAAVQPGQWVLAGLAVGVSFAAVGGQELTLHRHLRTGLAPGAVMRAGLAAGAVSQTMGFGPVTGALIRWRLLPGLTLWQATRVSVAMTVGFLSALAVMVGMVAVAQGQIAGMAVLAAAAVVMTLSAWQPRWLPRRAAWPNVFTLIRFLGWAVIDLVALAAALWLLFPPGTTPPFGALFGAVLLALGAGLLSGAPAGVGAFEITLMALLPFAPEAPLMAAIVAWRGVFYALPALLGAAFAALGPVTGAPDAPGLDLRHAPAEVGLARQGDLHLMPTQTRGGWLAGRCGHTLVAVGDPFGTPLSFALPTLRHASRDQGRTPALYKAGGRLALLARRKGWAVIHISDEAWLDPRRFDLATPARAGLRRKLRKAASAGITVTCGAHPGDGLCTIAAHWAAEHGGERGFSMGRYCPDYLTTQRLYVARQNGRAVAFASFHQTAREWSLDLMRHGPDLPDGTMQSLIATALADARARGVPRLSLAAVPVTATAGGRLARAALWLTGDHGAGLAQFKQGFAPRWRPLYLCAPHRAGLVLAAFEIGRAILRPGPLPAPPTVDPPLHEDHDQYEFATVPASWQRMG